MTINLPSDWPTLKLAPFGDLHCSDERCNYIAIEKAVRWCEKQENLLLAPCGDYGNLANRHSIGEVEKDMPGDRQMELAASILRPVADKIRVIGKGNHEDRVRKEAGGEFAIKYLAALLNKPWFEDGVLMEIQFGRRAKGGKQTYYVYATHGRGAGRTAGAKLNVLRDLIHQANADIYLMGHIHEVHYFHDSIAEPDKQLKTVRYRERWGLSCGAWLNPGGYSERQGYRPSPLSLPYLELSATEKHVVMVDQSLSGM